MIKGLKKIVVREESAFEEAYNAANTDWQEIRVTDLEMKRDTVKLEAVFLDVDGELNATTSTGRKTGNWTFSKPLGASALLSHSRLIDVGLGLTSTQSNKNSIVDTKTSDKILVVQDVFADKEVVYFDFAGDGSTGYSSFYPIETFATLTANLLIPINAADYAKIVAGVSKMKSATTITPAKTDDTGASFNFVGIFDDGRVEVLRGASLSISLEIVKEDKLELKFEVMSAFADSRDENNVVYAAPATVDIAVEAEDTMVYADFKNSYVYDAVTLAEKSVCPYMYALAANHSLIKEEFLCGVKGWYSKPDITGEIEFQGTPENNATFHQDNEALPENFLFFSQPNFAIYAEQVRLTNLNLGFTEEFDNFSLNTDVNHSANYKLRLIFPQ